MGIYVGHDVDGHSTIEPFASTNGDGNERRKHFLTLLFFLAVLLPALVGCGISGHMKTLRLTVALVGKS